MADQPTTPPTPPVPSKPSTVPKFMAPIAPPAFANRQDQAKPAAEVAVPTTVAPTPPAAATPIVIRTMQDDIQAAKQGPATPAPTTAPVTKPTESIQALPLPPKAFAQNSKKQPAAQKVVQAPIKSVSRSRAKRGGQRLIFALVIILILVAGSAVAVWYFAPSGSVPTISDQVAVTAGQILPANVPVIMEYRLNTEKDRADTMKAWGGQPANPISALQTVSGDPRALVTDTAVTQLFYVLLENDVRPYLVIPKTVVTTELIGQASDIQVKEMNGWYIAHPLNTQPYEQALQQSTVTAAGQDTFLQGEHAAGPLRIVMNSTAMPQLRREALGPSFVAGQLQELMFDGQFTADANGKAQLQLRGTGTWLKSLAAGSTTPALLQVIPSVATLARVGSNFATDLADWRGVAGVLQEQALEAPVVSQALAQFTGSYVFMQQKTGTTTSYGLVISVPTTYQITNPDPVVEQAISALVPLIVQQPTIAPITFNDATYQGIPLRYANIVSSSQALDYAVTTIPSTPGVNYLVIATSKDLMQQLLDTMAQPSTSLAATTPWVSIINQLPTTTSRDIVLGQLQNSGLLSLLPGQSSTTETPLPIGLSVTVTPEGVAVAGIVPL